MFLRRGRQREMWRYERRQIEAREDCETVSCCKQDIAWRADRSCILPCHTKEFGELAVLVQAEGEVGGGGCEEFLRARGGGAGGRGGEGGFHRVECVGCEVGSCVEGED